MRELPSRQRAVTKWDTLRGLCTQKGVIGWPMLAMLTRFTADNGCDVMRELPLADGLVLVQHRWIAVRPLCCGPRAQYPTHGMRHLRGSVPARRSSVLGQEPSSASGASVCTNCSDFGTMHISNTGRQCGTCAPGKQPDDARHSCIDCGAGEYSDGSVCQACPGGSQPKDDQSDCDLCLALGASLYSADGVSCSACGAGSEPFTDRTGCQSCSAVSDVHVSATGDACVQCGVGSQPTADATSCESCLSLTDGLVLVQCGWIAVRPLCCWSRAQYAAHGMRHVRRFGQYSSDGRECLDCAPGQGPTVNPTGCTACTGIDYSVAGVCQACLPPAMSNVAHITCTVPYECPSGTACLRALGCLQRDHCVSCDAGFMSSGGNNEPCTQCGEPGKRANDGKTACEPCPAGSEPSVDRSQCLVCAATNFSTFGIQCQVCASPSVVNDGHTTCSVCQAGTGPNDNRTRCVACVGNKFAMLGVCQLCPAGSVASPDNTRCDDASQGDLTDVSALADVLGSTNLIPKAALRAVIDIDDIDAVLADGSAAQVAFVEGMKQDLYLVSSLMVGASTLTFSGLRRADVTDEAGHAATGRRRTQDSVRAVAFEVQISGDGAAAAMSELSTQLTDPTSALRNSPTAGLIDLYVPPRYSLGCPMGMVRAVGAAQCSPCGYESTPNDLTNACRECPLNQDADGTGTVCVCKADYYNSSAVRPECFLGDFVDVTAATTVATAADLVCLSCVGMECIDECQGVDIKVSHLIHRRRALHSPSSSARTRPRASGCQLGTIANATAGCLRGYTEPLCGACITGFTLDPDGTCEPYGETHTGALIAGLCGTLLAVLLLAKIVDRWYVHVVALQAVVVAAEELKLQAIGKMVVATMQILGNISSVLKIRLPDTFVRAMTAFVSVFRFDIVSILSLGCLTDGGYLASLATSVLFVMVIATAVLMLYLYERRHGIEWLNDFDQDGDLTTSPRIEAHLRDLFGQFDVDGAGIELNEMQTMVRNINT